MRLALLIGLLALTASASSGPRPASQVLDPLVEAKVIADPAKRTLRVDIAWPSGIKPRFPRDDRGVISNRSVARVGALTSSLGRIDDDPEWASRCERDGCRLTYSVDYGLGAANDQRGGWGFEEKQRIILAPLARWLVRPEDRRARGHLSLDFFGGREMALVSGGLDDRPNHVEADLRMIDGPHVVLGHFTHKSIDLPGGRVDVAIGSGERGVHDDDLLKWIREGAQDVIEVLGRFPIQRLQVIVGSGGPYAVGSAVTMGMGGASIFVVVGERTRMGDLSRDWVMTHEMLHVAFPNLGYRQRWMEEGLSTYLEPLLRVRRGRYDSQKLWAEFARAMPQGLPKPGDEGLDRTYTWGRRYWGGALFWLHVDVEIRRRTGGAHSLDDVLRAVLAEGGNVSLRWDIDRLASVAEAATGTTALRDIYETWARTAVSPDLEALWSSLGVKVGKSDQVTFDDAAPLAGIRKGLTLKAPTPRLAAAQP